MDAIRRKKTALLDILSCDTPLVFDKTRERGLIMEREYRNMTNINRENPEGHVRQLLDKLMDKGEPHCEQFLDMLQTDSDILDTFPRLRAIQWPSSSSDGPGPLPSKTKREHATDTADADDRYLLTSLPVGLCLIINNKKFDRLSTRVGTENDAAELSRTFTSLSFRVLMCEDRTRDQMEKTLESVSSLQDLAELKQCKVKEWSESGLADLKDLPRHGDAFVCCILSHGNSQGVYGTDRESIATRDVITPFSSICRALRHKPKLFFIQACRGRAVQREVKADGDWDEFENRTSYSLPEYADFLIGFSTIDQYASGREPDGTWYMQILCKWLAKGCDRGEDILRILTRVTDDVCKLEGSLKGGSRRFKQSPDSMNTLRRQLFFRRI